MQLHSGERWCRSKSVMREHSGYLYSFQWKKIQGEGHTLAHWVFKLRPPCLLQPVWSLSVHPHPPPCVFLYHQSPSRDYVTRTQLQINRLQRIMKERGECERWWWWWGWDQSFHDDSTGLLLDEWSGACAPMWLLIWGFHSRETPCFPFYCCERNKGEHTAVLCALIQYTYAPTDRIVIPRPLPLHIFYAFITSVKIWKENIY